MCLVSLSVFYSLWVVGTARLGQTKGLLSCLQPRPCRNPPSEAHLSPTRCPRWLWRPSGRASRTAAPCEPPFPKLFHGLAKKPRPSRPACDNSLTKTERQRSQRIRSQHQQARGWRPQRLVPGLSLPSRRFVSRQVRASIQRPSRPRHAERPSLVLPVTNNP